MKLIAPSIKSFLFTKGFTASSTPQNEIKTAKNEEYLELCPPVGMFSKAIVSAVKEYFDTAGYATNEDHGIISVFRSDKQVYRVAVTGFNMSMKVSPLFGGQSGLMYLSVFHTDNKKIKTEKPY